jgi:hypothetical protein
MPNEFKVVIDNANSQGQPNANTQAYVNNTVSSNDFNKPQYATVDINNKGDKQNSSNFNLDDSYQLQPQSRTSALDEMLAKMATKLSNLSDEVK